MTPFHQILGNNLVANITNFTVWFAITFWVYLETHSVFATGTIAGLYLVFTAGFGIWLGSIVDHNAKKLVMLGSSVVSFGFYAVEKIQNPQSKLLHFRPSIEQCMSSSSLPSYVETKELLCESFPRAVPWRFADTSKIVLIFRLGTAPAEKP